MATSLSRRHLLGIALGGATVRPGDRVVHYRTIVVTHPVSKKKIKDRFPTGEVTLLQVEPAMSMGRVSAETLKEMYASGKEAVARVWMLVGALVTTLPLADYLRHPLTWNYLGSNLIFELRYHLPGAFVTNPYPNAVNGSIWTLPAETMMYVLVALTGLATLILFGLAFLLRGQRPALLSISRIEMPAVAGALPPASFLAFAPRPPPAN